MTASKKTAVWLGSLGMVVLCLSWQVYRQYTRHRQLCGILQSFIGQADFYEQSRNAVLAHGAAPSAMAQSLRNIVRFNDFGWAAELGQPSSDAAKAVKSAPQEIQYYVAHLQAMVANEKAAAISDMIKALRAKTGQDLGDDPEMWIQRYADKK